MSKRNRKKIPKQPASKSNVRAGTLFGLLRRHTANTAVTLAVLITLFEGIDYFANHPGLYNQYLKTVTTRQLEELIDRGETNSALDKLNSIRDNPLLADEYSYYSGMIRITNHGYPEGPGVFFESIKPNSPYYDKSIRLHYAYIQSIQNPSNRRSEIEFFQSHRLLGNELHPYYYAAEIHNLLFPTPGGEGVTLSQDYSEWNSLHKRFRLSYGSSVVFDQYPFRYPRGETSTGERTFNVSVSVDEICSVETVEFALQLGMYLSSNGQPADQREDHLFRLRAMLKDYPRTAAPTMLDPSIEKRPNEATYGISIPLNECLNTYNLQYLMTVAEKMEREEPKSTTGSTLDAIQAPKLLHP
jgi:hypothetical protein